MRRQNPYDGPLINIDPEFVLNTIEAGRMLGVSDREIRAKVTRGTLPAVKIGNKYLINRKAVCLYEHFYKLKKRDRRGARRPARTHCSCTSDYVAFTESADTQPYKVLFAKRISPTVSVF